MSYGRSQSAVWFGSPWGAVTLIALILLALYFLSEHTTHVLGLLPLAVILLCPLLHMFMHAGHGGHDDAGHAAHGDAGHDHSGAGGHEHQR